MFGTEAELVSGKLPLVVVRQLGGVNEGVVVSISALNDLPPDLVFGFLREEAGQQVVTDSQSRSTRTQMMLFYMFQVFSFTLNQLNPNLYKLKMQYIYPSCMRESVQPQR